MITRILLPLFILLAGFGAWWWLGQPVEAPKAQPHPALVLETEHLELQRTNYPVVLETQGTVRAQHNTTLTAQVAGTIKAVHPGFEDGAFFQKGEVLLELDPADLKALLISAESRLARSEAALAQEEARAKQARLNWEDIGYKEEPSPLVLRVPQLREANANVTAARAELDQASRNLDRAQIRAPFDGRVKKRAVGLGQAIASTTPLGEIFATDHAEVRLPLSATQLPFIQLPTGPDDPPVMVTLTDALSSKSAPQTWPAQIVRSEGTLDENSRELFAIARIDDPFGLETGKPQLRIGQPVRASIDGIILNDVFVLPRTALRGVKDVFLIDRETMTIQRTEVNPVMSTASVLISRNNFANGDWLATSRLPYAPDGAPIRLIEPAAEPYANTVAGKAVSSGS